MLGDFEPRPDFPADVQDHQEGAGEIGLEEVLGAEIGAADGVEGGVELRHEADQIHEGADVGAPDAEGGAEGEFVDAVALQFPGQVC